MLTPFVPMGGGGGGGAADPTWDLLHTIELDADSADFDFSGIDTAYRVLRLVFSGTGSALGGGLALRFNGDDSANSHRYHRRIYKDNSGTVTVAANVSSTFALISGNNVQVGEQVTGEVEMQCRLAAHAAKAVSRVMYHDSSGITAFSVCVTHYPSASLIDRVQLIYTGGLWVVGSHAQLFGRKVPKL